MERTGVCIEQPGIPGGVAACDYLEWWARLHAMGAPRLRAKTLLSEWEIPLDLPAERLSLGQRQILQVLRAMIHDPDLLLLDEPAGNLDPDSRARLHGSVRAWQERTGGALLLSTHHLDEALETADRVVFLAEGRIRADGGPDALGADPALSRLLRLEPGQDPSLAARALQDGLPGLVAAPAPATRGCPALRLTSPRGEEAHHEVLARLCATGFRMRSLDRDETTWRELWERSLQAPPMRSAPAPAPTAAPATPARLGLARSAWTTASFHLRLASRERRLFAPILALEAFFLGSLAFASAPGIPSPDVVALLLLSGVLPLGLSTSIAADTFAGERERRSLETMLCAPQTAWPLFLGKGLSALLPALALSWIAMGCAWSILAGSGNAPDLLTGFVIGSMVVPSFGGLATAFALAASRRARSVRAASQLSALGLLPILGSAQILPRALQATGRPVAAWAILALALAAVAIGLTARSARRSSPAELLR